MPTIFTNARLTGSPSPLQLVTASNICLRCRLSYLAVKRPTVPRQNVSLQINNIRRESRKCLSTTPESRDGTSNHRGPPRQVQDSIPLDDKGEITRSTTPKDVYDTSSFGKIDRRSNIPKLFSHFLDGLIAKAIVTGHRINTITGTDYSSIESLRKEIKEQGKFIKNFQINYRQLHS